MLADRCKGLQILQCSECRALASATGQFLVRSLPSKACGVQGHADCIKFMQSFNLPMLVLGGGGYKINNVARCWAYETGAILGG